jgi:hypothetical protein
MCDDKTIKELLPAYLDQAPDQAVKLMIESHLASCDECRTELSLLRLMAEEPVPDPGEAFWAAMPDRVYQAVQKRQTNKITFDLASLFDRMAYPRWIWAASTVGIVLIVSWLIVTPVQKRTEMPLSQGNEFADDSVTTWSVIVADLDHDELSTIDSWAGSELASMAQEAELVLANGRDTDIYEEFEDLNAGEVERISKMLEQIRREG